MKRILGIVVLLLLISVVDVYAIEVDENDDSCSYSSQAYLKEFEKKVEVSLNYKYDESGNAYFELSVYNITPEIYVTITNPNGFEQNINYYETNQGIYTFTDNNVEDIYDYKFTIYPLKYGCYQGIGSRVITKPKKNVYSDLFVCQYEEMLDYQYCKEWITTEISVSSDVVRKMINDEVKKRQKPATTKCVSCEIIEANNNAKNKFKIIKISVIVALLIGIVIDIIIIIRLLKKIKDAEI